MRERFSQLPESACVFRIAKSPTFLPKGHLLPLPNWLEPTSKDIEEAEKRGRDVGLSVWDTELTSVAQAHVFIAVVEKQPAFCFGVGAFKRTGKEFERGVDVVADQLNDDQRPGWEGHSLVEGLKRPGGYTKKRHMDFLLRLVNLCRFYDDKSFL